MLSKEELLGKEIEQATEEVYLGLFQGSVKIGAILDARDYNRVTDQARTAATMAAFPGNLYSQYPPEDLFQAAVISAGMIEPKLTFEEVVSLIPKLGPNFGKLGDIILKLSGLTETGIQKKEEALNKDPFPTDDSGDSDGVPASPSERVLSDDSGVDGSDCVPQDQDQG